MTDDLCPHGTPPEFCGNCHEEQEQREADEARRAAYEEWMISGDVGQGDLDLRAAAQWAQHLGNTDAERQIDDLLVSRGAE
jgi:hypothetical protein